MTLDDLSSRHIDIVVMLLSGDPDQIRVARQDLLDHGIDNRGDLAAEAERRVTDEYLARDRELCAEGLRLNKIVNEVPALGARTREDWLRLGGDKVERRQELLDHIARRDANARALLAATPQPEQLDMLTFLEEETS